MKKLTWSTVLMLLLVFIGSPAFCQEPDDQEQAKKSKPAKVDEPPAPKTSAIAIKIGTTGAGVEWACNFLPVKNITTRVGFTYLPISTSVDYNFSGKELIVDAQARLGSIGLMFDWTPLPTKLIKITAGVAYMLTRFEGNARFKKDVQQFDYSIPADEIGTIHSVITANSIAPYIGLGFGRTLPNKRVSFSADIGTFYHGKPTVEFVTTKKLAPTMDQQPKLEGNLDEYRWLPQLTFNIYFRLGK